MQHCPLNKFPPLRRSLFFSVASCSGESPVFWQVVPIALSVERNADNVFRVETNDPTTSLYSIDDHSIYTRGRDASEKSRPFVKGWEQGSRRAVTSRELSPNYIIK
jgi:hypothetical protein